ncbi:MAG: acetate kinase [Treponema sp.]|nr:acetate kinase [Treponema sp.]
MVILTLNCGSSSAKYQVYDWDNKTVLCTGVVERVTQAGSSITHKVGSKKTVVESPCPTHKEAIELIMKEITDKEVGVIPDMSVIGAVGHRLVHGGDKFTKSVIITPEVIETFREVQDLAPLHNPANIMGIEAAQKVLPGVTHCAIMDTAWHQTMPMSSYIYAIPREWYTKYHIRRYGFHGTSFLYTAKRAAVLLHKRPQDTNLIICHLGNGASLNAIKYGCSIDTSMGFTPLEGLIMGTRAGNIDSAIIFYLVKQIGMSTQEVENALSKQSGLLGITDGKFSDARDIEQAAAQGNQLAQLALEMSAIRIKKYIGSYKAMLGNIDAVVFTAGIGEHSVSQRAAALEGLEPLGIVLDKNKNILASRTGSETCISAEYSPTKVFVIPTDEELVMTEDTYALLKGTYDIHTKFTYSFQDPQYVNKARAASLQEELAEHPDLEQVLARP